MFKQKLKLKQIFKQLLKLKQIFKQLLKLKQIRVPRMPPLIASAPCQFWRAF
jgi:hypothetical protein